MFVAIMKYNTENRVEKYKLFENLQGAQDHVLGFLGSFPDAFAAQMPEGPVSEWLVDPDAETVSRFVSLTDQQAKAIAAAAELTGDGKSELGKIDRQAEIERGKYTTLAWAQERVYEFKEAEAVAWTANNSISASEIPYLTAEATATGKSVATLVSEITANGIAWRAISVGIEARRMGLKAAVKTALLIATRDVDPDPAASLTALAAIDVTSGWPSPS